MEYTVHALSLLTGVSDRTIRYYDRIGLLKPERITEAGYRLYAGPQLDRMQEILFYRALDFPLEEIRRLLNDPKLPRERSMLLHIRRLEKERERIEAILSTAKETLKSIREGTVMTDREKFEGFKEEKVRENEARYGKEIRARYGDAAIDASNEKFRGMTPEAYQAGQALEKELNEALSEAVRTGDPAGEKAAAACELHKRWLMQYWTTYSLEAHAALAEGYVSDPRFKAYYEKIAPGAAEFLRDALAIYCKKA